MVNPALAGFFVLYCFLRLNYTAKFLVLCYGNKFAQ